MDTGNATLPSAPARRGLPWFTLRATIPGQPGAGSAYGQGWGRPSLTRRELLAAIAGAPRRPEESLRGQLHPEPGGWCRWHSGSRQEKPGKLLVPGARLCLSLSYRFPGGGYDTQDEIGNRKGLMDGEGRYGSVFACWHIWGRQGAGGHPPG